LLDFPFGLLLARFAKSLGEQRGALMRRAILRYAQRRAEKLHARMRVDLLRSDLWQSKTLAISGKPE